MAPDSNIRRAVFESSSGADSRRVKFTRQFTLQFTIHNSRSTNSSLGIQRQLRRIRTRLRAVPTLDLLVVLRNHTGHRGDDVTTVEVHQLHALGVPAGNAHL